jgi:uncharacterized cupredoxin-like copper-binding protein
VTGAGPPKDSYTTDINGDQVSAPSAGGETIPEQRRTSRRPLRALPWLLAGLVLLGAGLPSVAAASQWVVIASPVGYAHSLTNTSLVVNMTDAPAFVPRTLSAPAGSNVSIHLVNTGAYAHTFTLANHSRAVLNTSWSPSQLYAYFSSNGSFANVSVAAHGQGWANFTLNASTSGDSFEFVSVVPYQFQAGMWGYLNITVSGPPLLLSDSTYDALTFVPAALAASPTSYPVNLRVIVTNQGFDVHTFTLSGLSNVTLSPANFTQFFAQHAPIANVTVPSGGGSNVTANVVVQAPGVYEYICVESGHFAAGMFGFLYVGVPVPPTPPAPSTAIVETWVLIGSAILAGIGGTIALATSLAGRLPRAPGQHGGHP